MPENLGRRIADLRSKLGWTQQELAERLAVSRVAVSHLEAGLSVPGERTVALLAGVFKMEPADLVEGTSYPPAKADRLPVVVARYTEIEQTVAVCEAELALLSELPLRFRRDRLTHWIQRLAQLADATGSDRERTLAVDALRLVRAELDALS